MILDRKEKIVLSVLTSATIIMIFVSIYLSVNNPYKKEYMIVYI